MVARPGDEAYGALSVLVAARARAVRLGRRAAGRLRAAAQGRQRLRRARAGARRRSEAAHAGVRAVVQVAFGQRRKNLRNALGAGFGREVAERALSGAAIDPGRRAEELSLEEFRRLSESFAAASGAAGR